MFYQLKTLKVLKAEFAPGKGGEHDVPGLYAHVMLQAYELSHEKHYLAEAEKAASRLKGSGLHLLYQTNNTLLSGVVLARLWRMTGKKKYRDLSIVCVANMIARVWMWECDYGFAKHYTNFMGASPLHECEYVAAYEEAEAIGKARSIAVWRYRLKTYRPAGSKRAKSAKKSMAAASLSFPA